MSSYDKCQRVMIGVTIVHLLLAAMLGGFRFAEWRSITVTVDESQRCFALCIFVDSNE